MHPWFSFLCGEYDDCCVVILLQRKLQSQGINMSECFDTTDVQWLYPILVGNCPEIVESSYLLLMLAMK